MLPGKEAPTGSHIRLPQGRAEEQNASFTPSKRCRSPTRSLSGTTVPRSSAVIFLEVVRRRKPDKYFPGAARQLLAAVPMKGPRSGAV